MSPTPVYPTLEPRWRKIVDEQVAILVTLPTPEIKVKMDEINAVIAEAHAGERDPEDARFLTCLAMCERIVAYLDRIETKGAGSA